jgi:hypothetical protein
MSCLFGKRATQGKQVHAVAKNSKPIGVCLEHEIGTDLTAAEVLDIESEEKYAVQASQEGELHKLASQSKFFDHIFEDFPASIRSWVAKREKVAYAQRMFYHRFASLSVGSDDSSIENNLEDDEDEEGKKERSLTKSPLPRDDEFCFGEVRHNVMAKQYAHLEASERATKDELSYGEVTFQAMAILLTRLRELSCPGCGESCPIYGGPLWKTTAFSESEKQQGGTIFFDLGSGCGRAVIAASILHPDFKCAIGVEILDGLHSLSVAVLDRWNSVTRKLHSSAGSDVDGSNSKDEMWAQERLPEIHFVNCDAFLETTGSSPWKSKEDEVESLADWTKGDVVLIDATCLDDTTLDFIAFRAKAMPDGAFLVTITAELPLQFYSHLKLCNSSESLDLPMNWGITDAFVYQRVRRNVDYG